MKQPSWVRAIAAKTFIMSRAIATVVRFRVVPLSKFSARLSELCLQCLPREAFHSFALPLYGPHSPEPPRVDSGPAQQQLSERGTIQDPAFPFCWRARYLQAGWGMTVADLNANPHPEKEKWPCLPRYQKTPALASWGISLCVGPVCHSSLPAAQVSQLPQQGFPFCCGAARRHLTAALLTGERGKQRNSTGDGWQLMPPPQQPVPSPCSEAGRLLRTPPSLSVPYPLRALLLATVACEIPAVKGEVLFSFTCAF